MSSTACDDQFLPPPDDLEAECREARAKVNDVCVWNDHFMFAIPGCRTQIDRCDMVDGYNFCPFCGKRIEVRQ
jgi:hypothetical protein